MVWPPILWGITSDVRDIEYLLSRTQPVILIQLELLLLYLQTLVKWGFSVLVLLGGAGGCLAQCGPL